MRKPQSVCIPVQDLCKLKPVVTDTLKFTTVKRVSIQDVQNLFPKGEIAADYIIKEMKNIKRELLFKSLTSIKDFKTWLHCADLSKRLKDFDYEQIAEFMNLHNGKYINVWKGYSKTDDVANINKLALFVRSISRINKLNFYKNLPEHDWEICMDGIINRPKEVIRPLMKYKFDSRKINKAVVSGTTVEKVKQYIEKIEKFLDSQKIKYDVKAYRGEGHFGILSVVKLDKDKTLQNAIEEFTQGIESGKYSVQQIDEFVEKNLLRKNVKQSRFLSTAIEKEAGDRYAKKILWYLDIPKGTKGSMIECYNVERASEAELLLQKGSNLRIDDAAYNLKKHIWELWATVLQ